MLHFCLDIDTDNPNCVVVGLAPAKFDHAHLNAAFRLLLEPHTELIAIHKGRYYRAGDGGLSLGPGAFVQCLEYTAGKKVFFYLGFYFAHPTFI